MFTTPAIQRRGHALLNLDLDDPDQVAQFGLGLGYDRENVTAALVTHAVRSRPSCRTEDRRLRGAPTGRPALRTARQ